MQNIVVIGAGQAGAALTAKLRELGYAGTLTLVGSEPEPPYQRPPLSKAYLLGEMEKDRLYLRPREFYAEHQIDLLTGSEAVEIDRPAQVVQVAGRDLPYDALALTTGSRARGLPAAVGGDLDGVVTVRTLADVDAMAPRFRDGARVLIVGGGYIGLEAAAVAAKQGLKVTLVEMADRILCRVAASQTADYFRALHTAHGVDIREGVGLERLTGKSAVTGAELSDGSMLEVDFVIVGIGILPEDRLAAAAGIETDSGILVNSFGQTSDPAIWAAGDCTLFPFRGQPTRLESVQNAIDQAEAVAANILGAETAYAPKPWFWSDQYDVKLQIAGLNRGYDRVVTRQGARDGTESHWYYRAEQLLAVDAMNDPRAYMVGKRLIDAGRTADPGAVADPGVELKTLLSG
ncbi:MAG: FAD-dependent oxidoreductase [Rhodobacteraceae bacterium]|nr:FAD-dependent oxidoreductase [Paracoccaceae bacterium]